MIYPCSSAFIGGPFAFFSSLLRHCRMSPWPLAKARRTFAARKAIGWRHDRTVGSQWAAPKLDALRTESPPCGRLSDRATVRSESRESNPGVRDPDRKDRSEEHTSELQSLRHLVCRLLLEK